MRTPFLIAVGIAGLTLAGCGGGTTDVSGRVTYKGKPVVFGTVVVVGSDGVPQAGAIQPDGTFRVTGVKVGPAKVSVSSPPPPGSEPAKRAKTGRDAEDDDKVRPDVRPADPEVVKNWVPLPVKYAEATQSGLTADVQPGQPLNLDLN